MHRFIQKLLSGNRFYWHLITYKFNFGHKIAKHKANINV